MIDYNKLRIAHELANELTYDSWSIDLWYWKESNLYLISFEDDKGISHEYEYENIDYLIAELTKLTQPKSKYKAGQEVWYLDLPINVIHSAIIIKIGHDEYVIDGSSNGTKDDFTEGELWPSRADLIEAQIKYWTDELKELPEFKKLTGQDQPSRKCPKCNLLRVSEGLCWNIGCDYTEDQPPTEQHGHADKAKK